ncbi:MAG: hypothetical protein AB1324_07520 [Candidatus Micrarchaeota archaeon]
METRKIAIIIAAILLGCLIVGIIGAFLAGKWLESNVSVDYENFRNTVYDCGPGSSGNVNVFGAKLNLTVVGLTTYRGRQVCHSSGTFEYEENLYDADYYVVDEDSNCMVLREPGMEEIADEDCDGSGWLGYTGG